MVHLAKVGITGLILAAVANAGQIQIGGPSGLTNSYITVGGAANSNPGGFTEQNFTNTLFQGATSAAPFTGYSQTATIASGKTLTDATADSGSGVTFAMIAGDSVSTNTANFWDGASGGSPLNVITIPVGIYGVRDVWTMLNLITGSNVNRDANVIFNFGSTATGAITSFVNAKLGNSGQLSSAAAAGDLQDSVLCSTGACATVGANGPTVASGSPPTAGYTGSSIQGVNIYLDTIFSQPITGTNASGNVVLDDQGFFFTGSALTTASSSYLVSIQVMEPNSVSGSAVGLSAITVDNTTPEPSTILLLLTGLSVIGFRRFRRA